MTRRVLPAMLFTAAGAAGCLSVPEGPAPMCHSTDDCDHDHGEVCDQGVCWGNPPPGPFAAVVSPPSMRPDLVSREIPQLAIPDMGWLGGLALEAPVLFSGKLVAFCPPPLTTCDPTPLAGAVTVARDSQFHGGPGFHAVVAVAASDSFSIPMRRTQQGDPPYTVTIVPDTTRQAGARSAAEVVPPRRLQLSVTDNTATQPIELGGADLPTISGTLVDTLGRGLANYRVSALGRWDPSESPVEVSTVDFTDATGAYAITLSDDLIGTVELVARPVAAAIDAAPPTAPAIHLAGIDATRASTQPAITLRDDLGAQTALPLQIVGLAQSGAVAGVSGAQVSITGVASGSGPQTSYTIADQQIADISGKVSLKVLGGAAFGGAYRVSITPPAGSTYSALYSQNPDALTSPVRLGPRLELHGHVVDGSDEPVANVSVTARPSLRFLWTLEAAQQVFAASIPAATTVTLATGEFILWVDPSVAGTAGRYDLVFEPPTTMRAPSFTKPDVEIPQDMRGTFDLGDVAMPDAAFVHGQITEPDAVTAVPDAELKLYQVSQIATEASLCSGLAHAPASCPIPAQLQARNASENDGAVQLALPR